MTHNIMTLIAEKFPSTKWSLHTNRNYVKAYEALKDFEDEQVAAAVRKLRSLLARNTISVEELIIEIRKSHRTQAQYRKVDTGDNNAAKNELTRMRTELCRESVQVVREAVTICRAARVLDGRPLSPRIEEWGNYAVGVVHAAIQRAREESD